MTNDELAWKTIKDMHISGPWQEHMVHKAIITAINSVGTSGPKWADIKDSQPEDGERVITWNNKFNEARIQVFNRECECWDTEDGDDIEWPLDATTKDGRPIIQYWQPLPEKPLYIEYIGKINR